MASNSIATRKLAIATDRIKSLRQRVKDSAEGVQAMAMSAGGAFAAPYLAYKFLTKDAATGEPKLLGLPGVFAIGAGLTVAGMVSDSEPLTNVGKGALYAAAAEAGAKAAK